jgi:metal-dependent amidase/aminoacylase/carboxypeptidase family protein
MPARDAARDTVFEAIRDARDEIITLSKVIGANPEVGGSETRAAELLTGVLERHGYEVERGYLDMPTAFRATKARLNKEQMRKGLRHAHLALLVEYDAPAGQVHSFGRHLSAGAGMAAAVGIGAALQHAYGTITVIGCPGGGDEPSKLRMVKAGVFEEFDAVIGAHPASTGAGYCYTINETGDTLGQITASIAFRAPNQGTAVAVQDAARRLIAELDASPLLVQEYETVTLATRAPTLDADEARVTLTLRARSRHRLVELLVDLNTLAERVAGEGGPVVDLKTTNVYDDIIVSRVIARRMKTWSDVLGMRWDKIRKAPPAGPSDWGNVSYISPAVQCFFPISTEEVTAGTDAFALAADTPEAYERAMRMGEVLAFTMLDLIRDMDFRAIADDQLVKALRQRGITRAHRRWTGVHPVKPRDDEPTKATGPKITEIKWIRGPGLPESNPFLPTDDRD